VKCPHCRREQPMSFKCRFCGEALTTQYPPPRRAAAPATELAATDPGDDVNPYTAPATSEPAPLDSFSPDAALAGRGARLAAHFLDGLLAVACMLPGMALLLMMPSGDAQSSASTGLALFGILLVAVGGIGLLIYQLRLLAREGQTWGKMKMSIRIVRHDSGEIPGLGRTLGLRMFVNGLIGSIPLLGPIYSLTDILFIFGEERRCLHDHLAGTKVVEAV
jgi:uncharacterized RDD family membrane protein YckC